jgi:hypothetical protein
MERHDFGTASPYMPVIAALLAFACDHEPDNADADTDARHLRELRVRAGQYERFDHCRDSAGQAVWRVPGLRALLIVLCCSLGLSVRDVSGYLYDFVIGRYTVHNLQPSAQPT